MPTLESTALETETGEKRSLERERFKLASVLAQIEIASCFRNTQEPLFKLLSPILYAVKDL